MAADDDYFDKIIQLAGGQNAYGRRGVRYPVVSLEGVMRLDPDVIVNLAPPAKLREIGRPAILKDWDDLKAVKAVKNGRVLIPGRDFALIPGPRFLELVEYLARESTPRRGWTIGTFCRFPMKSRSFVGCVNRATGCVRRCVSRTLRTGAE